MNPGAALKMIAKYLLPLRAIISSRQLTEVLIMSRTELLWMDDIIIFKGYLYI